MTKSSASLAMFLAAAIWGFAFVAQKSAMDVIGPFSFNAIRFLLGAICLHLVSSILGLSRGKPDQSTKNSNTELGRTGWLYAGVMGVVLFLGANTQQIGLVTTTAGKAAFITGLYIVIVPLLMRLRGDALSGRTWLAVLIAVTGLYLLSVSDGFGSISRGDIWVLASALLFAIHIVVIGRASRRYDPIKLSIIQFYICALLSAIAMVSVESLSFEAIANAYPELLYAGVGSVAIAYTLQVVGQKYVVSHVAALILSLEAVFGALGGFWLLDETMTSRMMWGCALMFSGWVLAQIQAEKST